MNILDSTCLNVMGGIQVTFTPQDASGAKTIQGLVQAPVMDDSPSTLRLFVKLALVSPTPKEGDLFSFNGVSYVLQLPPNTDTQGGAVLKLKVL